MEIDVEGSHNRVAGNNVIELNFYGPVTDGAMEQLLDALLYSHKGQLIINMSSHVLRED